MQVSRGPAIRVILGQWSSSPHPPPPPPPHHAGVEWTASSQLTHFNHTDFTFSEYNFELRTNY